MEIKIIYQDETTGQVLREVIVDEPEVKGLDFLEEDFMDWHEKAGRQKADIMIDRIVEENILGPTNISRTEKEQFVSNFSLKSAKELAAEQVEDIQIGLGILPKKGT